MAQTRFHEVSFPLRIALGATGGPVRRTEVLALASGHEQRNQRWAGSRRRYDVATGVRTLDDLHVLVEFFEARSGRLYGFRFRDPFDHRSGRPGVPVSPVDQTLGSGDGKNAVFELSRSIGGGAQRRRISKPIAGSVRVAVDGRELTAAEYSIEAALGTVTLAAAPTAGARVTAGFEFEVPVRFDTDEIRVSLTALSAGQMPPVALMEIMP